MVANSRLLLQPSPFKYEIKDEVKEMEKVSLSLSRRKLKIEEIECDLHR